MRKKHVKTNMIILIIIVCLCITSTFAQSSSPERIISLDFNRVKGPMNTMFKECVGAGRANEGLRADWQQHLAYVKKECGFKYLRITDC